MRSFLNVLKNRCSVEYNAIILMYFCFYIWFLIYKGMFIHLYCYNQCNIYQTDCNLSMIWTFKTQFQINKVEEHDKLCEQDEAGMLKNWTVVTRFVLMFKKYTATNMYLSIIEMKFLVHFGYSGENWKYVNL